MRDANAQRALTASALALVVACAAGASFLPPMLAETLGSLPRTALLGLALTAGALLHWVWLGMGAGRLHRSVPGWVALAFFLFPIGGVAALLLLWGCFGADAKRATPAPASGT
ncbi:MAG: hypothetical protein OEU93_10315 [Rubrivivax sp.]|nr:hypothetical protein [Rubrivivax sp.]MDH5339030.1 hypothetical protein [Rubrivivax sp.]